MLRALLLLCLCAATHLYGQTRPDFAPEQTANLDEVCFYTQEVTGELRKVCIPTLQKEFAVGSVSINYVPSATGNPDRNTFVVDPSGKAWFIDYLGNALKIANESGKLYVIQEVLASGSTVLVTVPIPADISQLIILRSGRETSASRNDFTRSGNTLTFTVPLNQEWITIKSPL